MTQGMILHAMETGTYGTSALLSQIPGVRHGFTTRLGGVSPAPLDSLNLGFRRGDDPANVLENYRRAAKLMHLPFTTMTATSQIHSDRITRVLATDAGRGVTRPADWKTDGLITDVPGLVLCAFSADCNVLLLCDPVHHAVGAIHAGWRGTAQNIAGKAVGAMTAAFGTNPADLFVALAPSIGPCCFETHADVPTALSALEVDVSAYLRPTTGDKYQIDLPGVNSALLRHAGVPDSQINLSGACTCCDRRLYWSHRRDGEARGVQAGMIVWEETK